MSKRRPGRPKGTELVDDGDLEKIADLILAEPRLRPTTAIKRLNIYDESKIRRLRGKWKARGVELLAQVKARREKTQQPVSSSSISRAPRFDRNDIFSQIHSLGAGISGTEQLERALGLRRSYLDEITGLQKVKNDLGQSTFSKLMEAGMSFVDKIGMAGESYRVCGVDIHREMCGTERLHAVALETYNLTRKYG